MLNIFCSNQTLLLEDFLTHLNFFNIHIIQQAQLCVVIIAQLWDIYNIVKS
jgi:uncharacterized protein YfkK (UPF0435 family)